jgi:hypothetical protein
MFHVERIRIETLAPIASITKSVCISVFCILGNQQDLTSHYKPCDCVKRELRLPTETSLTQKDIVTHTNPLYSFSNV